MTNVLYDLLFVLPLSILATALGEPYFGGPENGLPLYLITLLITGTCLTVKHWENRLKYLLPGVLLAFASGVILIRVVLALMIHFELRGHSSRKKDE